MNMNRLIIGLGMILIMAVAFETAEAKSLSFKSDESGSYVTRGTPIDIDGDGKTATLALLSGTSNALGDFTVQTVVEFSPTSLPATCPNGNAGSAASLVGGGNVLRTAKGDLLFATFTSGSTCFDPITQSSFQSMSGSYTGGTGKFAGKVGGSIVINSTSRGVVSGVPPEIEFGGVVSHSEGTLPQ